MKPKPKAFLVGGAIIGILSVIPIVNFGCCLWAVLGGAVGTYIYKRNLGKIELRDGGIIGGLSGVFGALIFSALVALIYLLMGGAGAILSIKKGMITQAITSIGMSGIGGVLIALMTFGFNLLVLGLFGLIGGLITAALLEE